MKVTYERPATLPDLLHRIAQLSARTIIFDVEPLIAYWDSDQETLDMGLARMISQVAEIPGVLAVCFSTNSARRPSAVPASPGMRVVYLASARKPLRTSPYRDFPRPGVVVGDQVATDGMLARRLGYTFLHYCPQLTSIPAGPRLMNRFGRALRPLLFARSG